MAVKRKVERKVKRKGATVKPPKAAAPVAAACTPENPGEARAWLRTIGEHIKETIKTYSAHEPPAPAAGDNLESYVATRARRDQWLADRQRLWWFFRAVKVYGSKKNKKSLDQLLGLTPGRGRSVVQERRDKILKELLDIVLLRSPRGPTGKAERGRPAPPPWKVVAGIRGKTVPADRKLYARELPNLPKALAKGISARMKQKPPPIGKAKARNETLVKEIRAHNRRTPKAKAAANRRAKSQRPSKSAN